MVLVNYPLVLLFLSPFFGLLFFMSYVFVIGNLLAIFLPHVRLLYVNKKDITIIIIIIILNNYSVDTYCEMC